MKAYPGWDNSDILGLEESMKKLNADTVTAIASVIIALAAIFISVWQGVETRKHNQLSVTPKLDIFQESRQKVRSIGLFIANHGLGPAIIGDIIISVRETQFKVNTENGLIEVLDKLGINEQWVQYHYISQGSYFQAGERRLLLAADRSKINIDDEHRFKGAISLLKVRIDYESVYGEKFHVEVDYK